MDEKSLLPELPRRDWIYAMQPFELEIGPCPKCGNQVLQWSCYKNKCWCADCAQDVTPEHWGILDGPVPVDTCQMLGIRFDSIDLRCMQLVPFESESWPYSPLFNKWQPEKVSVMREKQGQISPTITSENQSSKRPNPKPDFRKQDENENSRGDCC